MRVLRDESVVVGLVEVEAGFLSAWQFDAEFEAGQGDFHRSGGLAAEDRGVQFEAFGLAHGGVVAGYDTAWFEDFFDGVGDEVLALVHREGERLQDGAVAVAVEDQARQSVAFAPDFAAGAGVESEFVAVFARHRDAAAEEVGVEVLALTREAAGGDFRAAVVDGAAEKAVALVFQSDDGAVLRLSGDLEHFVVVDPIVSVENARAGADNDARHALSIRGWPRGGRRRRCRRVFPGIRKCGLRSCAGRLFLCRGRRHSPGSRELCRRRRGHR